MITELNERSRAVFRFIVDSYLETGEPVGSRLISNTSGIELSPASIRNVMSLLEREGLLYSPHTSAGRLPTDTGLRLYVDGLMQIGDLGADEQKKIEATCKATGKPLNEVLESATSLLSGLSSCASLVISPKTDAALKQIQFVELSPGKILAILVMKNGLVENRIINLGAHAPPEALISAANYLNTKFEGRKISTVEKEIKKEINNNKTQLDSLTQELVKKGLALQSSPIQEGHMIIRGQSRLLRDVKALEDLERARLLLGRLEEQQNMLDLLETIDDAEGVQIFIGTENKIFDQTGWSIVISPYRNMEEKIIGAIGVIGPTRLSYNRIIPMVDYTSHIVGKLLDEL